jgi:hypothetical protein
VKYQATGYFWENPQKAFSISVDIDPKRFEAVESAKNTCLLALGLEEKFQLVVDNYIEWETELLKQAQVYMFRQPNKFEAMEHRVLVARRLTNVLTGFRLYVDQTDYLISKVFGGSSEELKTIKKFKSNLYDSHFGYRFLEALRNHVQHCDLPIETLTYNSKLVDREKAPQVQFSVLPIASLESLAENEDFKKSILKELEAGQDKIDLRPHVREYVSCLIGLHRELEKIFSPKFEEARNYYQESIREYSILDGKSVQHPKFVFFDEAGLKEKTVELYAGFLEIYNTLKRRNENAREISKSFVSNMIALK